MKHCILGDHDVEKLWKSNPPACKYCWAKYKSKTPKPVQKQIADIKKEIEKRQLSIFFSEQVRMMPKFCENCGEYLNPYAPWGAKAYIAHILPKRIFKSVMIHPDNCVFLCIGCHTDYDNMNKVERMKVLPLIKERFKSFKNAILENNPIPKFLD